MWDKVGDENPFHHFVCRSCPLTIRTLAGGPLCSLRICRRMKGGVTPIIRVLCCVWVYEWLRSSTSRRTKVVSSLDCRIVPPRSTTNNRWWCRTNAALVRLIGPQFRCNFGESSFIVGKRHRKNIGLVEWTRGTSGRWRVHSGLTVSKRIGCRLAQCFGAWNGDAASDVQIHSAGPHGPSLRHCRSAWLVSLHSGMQAIIQRQQRRQLLFGEWGHLSQNDSPKNKARQSEVPTDIHSNRKPLKPTCQHAHRNTNSFFSPSVAPSIFFPLEWKHPPFVWLVMHAWVRTAAHPLCSSLSQTDVGSLMVEKMAYPLTLECTKI